MDQSLNIESFNALMIDVQKTELINVLFFFSL